MKVRRVDVGNIAKPVKQPNGFLRVDAHLTRTGVFAYRNADGTVRKEYRPPDEVFKPESLASFALVPLTNGHPPEGLLTSENTGRYQVGTVGEAVRQDGELVRASILVTDAATIKEMESGNRFLSCGYEAEVDETPGVAPNGERYDAVQRAVVGNHVALVRAPRAGEVARVHLDTSDNPVIVFGSDSDSGSNDTRLDVGTEGTQTVKKIHLDGVEVEVSETAAVLIEKQNAAHAAALKAAKDASEAARARADGLDADLKKAKAELTDLPAKVRAEIDSRVSLESKARTVLGTVKLDGKTDREVKLEVLARLDSAFDAAGKSDAYIEAAFDYQVGKYDAEDPAAEVERAERAAPRTDSSDPQTAIEKAEAAFRAAAATQLKK